MFVIVTDKYRAISVQAHERSYSDGTGIIHHNDTENKWAVEVSGKFNHSIPLVDELKGDWRIVS